MGAGGIRVGYLCVQKDVNMLDEIQRIYLHGTLIGEGTTVYSTTFPCMNCLKLLINAGVRKIVYKEGYNMDNEIKRKLLEESQLIIEKSLFVGTGI